MINVQLSCQTEHSVDWLVSSAAMVIDPLQAWICESLQPETLWPTPETQVEQSRSVEPLL